MMSRKNITLEEHQQQFLEHIKKSFDFSKWVRAELNNFVRANLNLDKDLPVTKEHYEKLEKRLK